MVRVGAHSDGSPDFTSQLSGRSGGQVMAFGIAVRRVPSHFLEAEIGWEQKSLTVRHRGRGAAEKVKGEA